MKLKRLLFYWAHLDLDHTCDKNQTYFARYAEEIGQRNLTTLRYLSAFFVAISAFVVIIASALLAPLNLRVLYSAGMALEFGICISLPTTDGYQETRIRF